MFLVLCIVIFNRYCSIVIVLYCYIVILLYCYIVVLVYCYSYLVVQVIGKYYWAFDVDVYCMYSVCYTFYAE